MADNKDNGFLKSMMGEMDDFIKWIKETLGDDEVRRSTLLNLGLDPDEAANEQIPESDLSSIDEYRKSANPDDTAFQSAVEDVKLFYGTLKDYFKAFNANPFDLDELLWHFFEIMGTNYIRLHYPKTYYLFQLLGFLAEIRPTPVEAEDSAASNLVLGLAKTPMVIIENFWDFITDPVDYVKNIIKKLKNIHAPGMETTADAEKFSLLFLSIPLLIGITDNDIDLRYLYGWDVLPRKMSDEDSKVAFRTSPQATPFLKRIREDFKDDFPLPADDDEAWEKIEELLTKENPERKEERIMWAYRTSVLSGSSHAPILLDHLQRTHEDNFPSSDSEEETWKKLEFIVFINDPVSEPAQKIISAYKTALKKWERGEWTDIISETAFTFDIKLPSGDNLESYLGASLMIISKEDEPTELQNNDGIVSPPSGGLFVSLNEEANLNYPINDNWDFIAKTSSGNLLDFYASGNADLNVFGDDIKLELALKRKVDTETKASYNLPDASGTRLAIGELQLSGFISKKDAGIEISAKKNALVISSGKADGFLQEIMPSKETDLKFSITTGFSKKRGFYFTPDIGSLSDLLSGDSEENEESTERSLTAKSRSAESSDEKPEKSAYDSIFPIHKDLGIINFERVDWSYGKTNKADKLGARVGVTSTFSSKLGPVYVRVEGIGMKLDASMPQEGGDLSTIDLDFGFVTPKRIGLRIESEVISGGGFLEFDPDNHRYAGILSLNFLEIELTAIGLINTRLPNNQKGFSMLISINVLFAPPIQLAYGFTLNGVGGLIGIRRTVKVDVLQNHIRKGSITSIMFPEDVIKNAPKIISDLRAIFPPKKGHYIIAPFLRIGWGTPTIVEIDLGILIEIPFKSRLILLGSVGLYLPNKTVKKRLVELHIDIFGDFNFAESYVLIEGRLRDSHVVGIKLTGGFAFVLDWGSQPQFLMSVGGYHPRYKKPARFPDIPRLTALVKKGDDITLTCEYYQAITSNSFQIGFSANLIVRKGRAKAVGFLGFNALLQFDPFRFEIDIHINVSVSYRGRRFLGVELYFELSGPKPWRAKGYAKIDLWLFSLKVRFNYEWGGKQKVARRFVKTVELLGRLQQELDKESNWSAKLANGFSNAAALRKLKAEEQTDLILVHPSGFLELRQTLLPLHKTINKLGSEYVSKAGYEIVDYKIGAESTVKIDRANLREHFSRGQFEELPDDKKLSTPDFELMSAGISLSGNDAYDFSSDFAFTANDFEDIPNFEASGNLSKKSYNWQQDRRMNVLINREQLAPSSTAANFGMIEELPTYKGKQYYITHKDTLEIYAAAEQALYFDTYSETEDYLDSNLKTEKWQVMETV